MRRYIMNAKLQFNENLSYSRDLCVLELVVSLDLTDALRGRRTRDNESDTEE